MILKAKYTHEKKFCKKSRENAVYETAVLAGFFSEITENKILGFGFNRFQKLQN